MHGSQMMYAILFMIAQACDPMLASLFTPPRPEIGHYDVCTRSDSLETVMAEGRTAGIQFGEVDAVEPLDGFGSAGAYNRFALVKLYGGMRVRVTRGWRRTEDRFESVTLLSPHPDETLTRLDPGTMVITFILTGRDGRGWTGWDGGDGNDEAGRPGGAGRNPIPPVPPDHDPTRIAMSP